MESEEQASEPRTGGFRPQIESQKFSSENPFFIVKIMQDNLSRSRTTIPNAFFTKYFKKKQPNVKIQFENKLWPAKLLYYPSLYKAYISSGWQPFILPSNLKAGDVCVFELIKVEERVLDVHIYRADG
ncbi:60S ribosomal protein L7-like 1 [Stylosanthes scabra]|uniref:60S ribosomal protein L7-like 1 n=1 Tax=Stylosanthes scabra TaxID=79078 RepID=A0ABU6TS10_9FABA|nr:60S ribosomal protein L7-like 1 [Stylosanthes scabra]